MIRQGVTTIPLPGRFQEDSPSLLQVDVRAIAANKIVELQQKAQAADSMMREARAKKLEHQTKRPSWEPADSIMESKRASRAAFAAVELVQSLIAAMPEQEDRCQSRILLLQDQTAPFGAF